MQASPEVVASLAIFRPDDGPLEIVSVSGDDSASRRLCELGICAGKTVSMVKCGDPAIVSAGGSRFALAGALQDRIFARQKRS
ncbi:MAG: ferrous iron transport protein A [Planctomycetes bacterium]|nr:ferrous iron transport protein A [Planctomycetota bacterium]